MKDYSTYEPQDFLQDDSFVDWLREKKPMTGKGGIFWTNWIAQNPSKKQVLEKAEEIFLALTELPEQDTLENAKSKVWNRIDSSIEKSDDNFLKQANSKKVYNLKVWGIAASVALLIGLGILFGLLSNERSSPLKNDSIVENTSEKPMTVTLSDGSSVKLFSDASLSYPEIFEGEYRQVAIKGKAFFEVAKKEKQPFIVYSYHFATKVLGTSFIINDGKNKGEANVSVIRGRVEVFEQQEHDKAVEKGDIQGTVIKDKERVVYSSDGTSLLKEDHSNTIADAFIFKNTPMREVLEQVKQFYGIEVIVSQESLEECFFNASLVDIPLMEKISLLCSAMGYEYTFENNTLTLIGSGCN